MDNMVADNRSELTLSKSTLRFSRKGMWKCSLIDYPDTQLV